jgi:hypothetical protein
MRQAQLMTKTVRNTASILLLAAPFYIAGLLRNYIGITYDDSKYILIAKSLLAGHYVALDLPGLPPLNYHLPGFSLFLVPFVWLIQPSWVWLKLIPLILTFVNGVLFWYWLEGRTSDARRTLIVAVYTVNHVTVMGSGVLMAEPLFLCLVFLIMGQLFRQSTTTARDWVCGGLLAYSISVRPEGIALCLSLALSFLWIHQKDRFKRVLSLSLLSGGVGLALMGLTTHEWPGYVLHWTQNLKEMNGVSHIIRLTLDLIAGSFLALPMPTSYTLFLFGISLSIAATTVILFGLKRFLSRKESPEESIAVIGFCLFYFFIHALWPVIDSRFYLPLVPFLIFFFTEGLQEMTWIPKTFARILMILLLGTNVAFDIRTLLKPKHGKDAFPYATFEWVRSHIPHATFVAEGAPTFSLYTGNPAVPPMDFASSDIDDFRFQLLSHGIEYLYDRSSNAVWVNVPNVTRALRQWEASRIWRAQRTDAFELLYENKAEETVIYRIKKDDAFLRAKGIITDVK